MNRHLIYKEFLVTWALLLSAVFLPCAALADSKSKTVRISCTVVPMIELTQRETLSVQSNLGKQYRLLESQTERAGQKVQLYSLTAL